MTLKRIDIVRTFFSIALIGLSIALVGCGEKPATPAPTPEPRRVQSANFEFKVNGNELVYNCLYGCFTDGVEGVLYVDGEEKDRTLLKRNDTVALEEMGSCVLKASDLALGSHECKVQFEFNGKNVHPGGIKSIEIK